VLECSAAEAPAGSGGAAHRACAGPTRTCRGRGWASPRHRCAP
jgi:hypothetical protein